MSIDQKIGQIIQLDVEGITDNEKTNPQEAADLFIGSLFVLFYHLLLVYVYGVSMRPLSLHSQISFLPSVG